jgi:hypothetical protein
VFIPLRTVACEHRGSVSRRRLDCRYAAFGPRQRRVATRLTSRALMTDPHQTDLCAYLSGILFVSLALNALFGWWWADSIAAILMVPIITREGIEALSGDPCDACH